MVYVNSFGLFSIVNHEIEVPSGLRMIGSINGFTDAGQVIEQMAHNILNKLDAELVVVFDNDELLDYRARRPSMFFEKDHLATYEPALLGVYLVRDESGIPFLFLHGYEPDFRWEAFADAIEEIIETFAVTDFTWVHSIPFPVPHTRPVGITVSGNRKELIERFSEWRPETQVPGNVVHLLEYRLTRMDVPVVGFVLLVPHYLNDSDYPNAAVTGFELITAATGLVFPTDQLRDEGVRFIERLEKKMEENEELAKLVENLEQGYKSDRATSFGVQISSPKAQEPNAEDIAAELEDYLANRQRNNSDDD
jgi:predicted ATP-grasp superfamily ATP-dependent carboligase